MKDFNKLFSTQIWVMPINVNPQPYYPDGDYILVSASGDEEKMKKQANIFLVNSLVHNFDDGFIIPLKVFDKVLKPIFVDIKTFKEAI